MPTLSGSPFQGPPEPASTDSIGKSLQRINLILAWAFGLFTPSGGGTIGNLSISAPQYSVGTGSGNGSFTISTEVLAGNASRKTAYISNNGSVALYLNVGLNAVAGQGIYLTPGAVFEINSTNLTTSPIYAIPATGSGSVSVMEGV